jgi:UDP-glucose 4-epimerase
MKAMIVGSSGLYATALRQRLRDDGVDVVVLTSNPARVQGPCSRNEQMYHCDIADQGMVHTAMRVWKPEVVFHMGAISIVKENAADPCRISRINVLGTHHLLAHAPEGCRFVFASSATVYDGGSRWLPCKENDPFWPSSVYAATKIAGESLVKAYTELGRVKGISLRCVAGVGWGATHGLVYDLIRKLYSCPELHLIGEAPGSIKPYMLADDVAGAFSYFGFGAVDEYRPVNIAPGDSVSVEEVAHAVMDAIGINKPIVWDGWGVNWAGDVPEVFVDNYDLRHRWSACPAMDSCKAVSEGALQIWQELQDNLQGIGCML